MKKSIRTLAASAFIAGSMLTSCKTPAGKVDNAKENATEAKNDLDKANEEYQVEIENYRKETAQKITDNDKIIADFETKIENKKKDDKGEYEKKINELEKKNRELKKSWMIIRRMGKKNGKNLKQTLITTWMS